MPSFSLGNAGKSMSRPLCDPALFEDPIAEQVLWSPLQLTGASNCITHRAAISADGNQLEFQQTQRSNFYVGAMLVAGGVLPAAAIAVAVAGGDINTIMAFGATGLLLGAVGVYFWHNLKQPRVFDRRVGRFQVVPPNPTSREQRLSEIHALQIVSQFITMDDSPDFYCHQLNLVLKNAARLNVIAHGSYHELRKDAEVLGDFLNVPVWDQAKFE